MINDRTLGTGTFITLGAPVVTEIISMMGYDWLLLDMEHGCITEGDLLPNLQAMRPGPKAIVRVMEPNPTLISRVLDAGAHGIMVPHVSSAEQAKAIVDAMYYAPKGSRGYSTSVRAMQFGMNPVNDTVNWEAPLLLAQIENREGVESAQEIAAVPGVDMLFVGPRDLSLDLSVRPDPMDFNLALELVAKAAQAEGKQAGILVRNLSEIDKLKSLGYTALAIGSDLAALRNGYKPFIIEK